MAPVRESRSAQADRAAVPGRDLDPGRDGLVATNRDGSRAAVGRRVEIATVAVARPLEAHKRVPTGLEPETELAPSSGERVRRDIAPVSRPNPEVPDGALDIEMPADESLADREGRLRLLDPRISGRGDQRGQDSDRGEGSHD